MSHIIVDADREVGFGLILAQFIQRGFDHCRGKFFRGQTISSADGLDGRSPAFDERVNYIQVERFAGSPRFFGAVQHGDRFHALGQSFHKVFHREGAI